MSVRPSVDKTLKHIEHNRNQTKPDEFIKAQQNKAKNDKNEKNVKSEEKNDEKSDEKRDEKSSEKSSEKFSEKSGEHEVNIK